MVSTADVRVGDTERQAAVDRLLAHTSEGRLTVADFDNRAAAAYAARTRGELDRLFTDLPPHQPAPPRAGNVLAGHVRPVAMIVAAVAGLLVLLGLAAPAFAGGMMAACM